MDAEGKNVQVGESIPQVIQLKTGAQSKRLPQQGLPERVRYVPIGVKDADEPSIRLQDKLSAGIAPLAIRNVHPSILHGETKGSILHVLVDPRSPLQVAAISHTNHGLDVFPLQWLLVQVQATPRCRASVRNQIENDGVPDDGVHL